MNRPQLRVLFLCTGNSCRSQMAEGWCRKLHAGSIEPYSAGVRPTTLNPLAVQAMTEVGIDISRQAPKHVDALAHVDFDYVITVCDDANENCPVWRGNTRRLHVGFEDPPRLARAAQSDEEAMPHYRRVRDEIRDFAQRLPDELRKEHR